MKWPLVALLLMSTSRLASAEPAAMDGDIIFHTSTSSQSIAIQQATRSRYSHMGVIFIKDNIPHVFEAISTVQFTPLSKWTSRGEGMHYVIKRPRHALTQTDIDKIKSVARTFEGAPYDLTFEWADGRIYCSELVWKLYKRALGIELGTLARLRDFDLSQPAVKKKLRERDAFDAIFNFSNAGDSSVAVSRKPSQPAKVIKSK